MAATCATCTLDSPCTAVQLLKQSLETHEVEAKERFDKVDKVLDKLQNRLPLWTTMLISLLTMAVGFLLKN